MWIHLKCQVTITADVETAHVIPMTIAVEVDEYLKLPPTVGEVIMTAEGVLQGRVGLLVDDRERARVARALEEDCGAKSGRGDPCIHRRGHPLPHSNGRRTWRR